MKRVSYLEGLKEKNPDLYIKLMIKKGVRAGVNAELKQIAAIQEQLTVLNSLVAETAGTIPTDEQNLRFLQALFSVTLLTLK